MHHHSTEWEAPDKALTLGRAKVQYTIETMRKKGIYGYVICRTSWELDGCMDYANGVHVDGICRIDLIVQGKGMARCFMHITPWNFFLSYNLLLVRSDKTKCLD